MNILCPVSDEKINEKIVRYIAFATFLMALIYIFNPHIILLSFLAFDFFSRGFGFSRFSPLSFSGSALVDYIPFKSKRIDKAPKIFAARIGFMLSVIAMILLFSDAILASQITILIIAFFAFLEWSVSFCMGCYIYSWIIVPWFTRR